MRFINLTFLLTIASGVSATGLEGRHEGHDHGNSSSMASISSSSSSLSPSPTASSANAAASSSGAAFHITQPGAITGALAVVVALMV